MSDSTSVVHDLIRLVVLSFYEEKHVVLVDYLLSERILPADVIADRMNIAYRDVGKVCARLCQDRLLSVYLRSEGTSVVGDGNKSLGRPYYYIDYGHFVNVVKYRLYRMRADMDERYQKEAAGKGYYCEHCSKTFSVLEATALLNHTTFLFECDVCASQLVSLSDARQSSSSLSRDSLLHSKLVEQTNPILRLLKQLDSVTLAPIIPEEYIREHASYSPMEGVDASMFDASNSLSSTSSLSTIGDGNLSSSRESAHQTEAPIVEIVYEEPSTVAPVVHSLPSWHQQSTVTGRSNVPIAAEEEGAISDHVEEDSSLLKPSESEYIERYAHGIAPSEPQEAVSKAAKRVKENATAVMVMVQGAPKNIDDITDQDKELMTEEEYLQYYEVYSQQ